MSLPVRGPTVLVEGGTFGPYEVRRQLAVGGMGEIYLCRHRVLDRFDAVKVLRPHLSGNVDFRRRFLREALAAARLRHPHVVTVYTADERDGLLYLAMEYVAGEDLARLIQRTGRLDPGRTTHLIGVAADALDAAHAAQLVHRDVKPSNLLVTAPGTAAESVTLVDFGVSRLMDADSDITHPGEIVGTIAYSAPEQLSRGPVVGACDQYALACVAFECLTGQLPYPRASQLAVMAAHLRAAPPSATALCPDLPPAVDPVLARAMSKDSAARYLTCAAFAGALRSALGGVRKRSAFPGPKELVAMVRGNDPAPPRAPDDPDFGALRVGWAGDSAMVLERGPAVIRAEPEPAADLVRWLIAQVAARHQSRHLCLACALGASAGESWLWVNWLPQARPDNPPLAGPHYATSSDAAADLMGRLRAVVASRRADGGTTSGRPRVLAILDAALGVRLDEPELTGAAAVGVDLILIAAPGAPVPAGASTLDVSGAGALLTHPGGRSVTGDVDGVSGQYVRDLAESLPEA